jgi:hypothetical protein
LLFLAALLAGILSSAAQDDDYPKGPEGGHKLASELCALRPVQDTNWQGVLKISGRNHKTFSVPVTCVWKTGETSWSVTYATVATNTLSAEKLTIVFSTNASPQYWYARAAAPGSPPGEAKLLTGSAADLPFAGSDFWLSDLGFEFYHWPGQNLLKGELRRGQSCFVLECTNPNALPGGYGRAKVWVDKKSKAPLEAEAYGQDGNLLKDFELGSVTKINDQYELKDLKIANHRTDSRTQLLFDLKTGDSPRH